MCTSGIDVTFATPARIDFCRIVCESAESDDNDICIRVIVEGAIEGAKEEEETAKKYIDGCADGAPVGVFEGLTVPLAG